MILDIYGVYACAEHEFSIATSTLPGANPFDLLESFDHVQNLAQNHDYTIVLYHGGKELYQYPSPYLQRICRKFVEKGANLVVCQHSHCIGCQEIYKDGLIIYGQGNFLFDRGKHKMWETGLLIQIDDEFDIKLLPIIKNRNMVRLASMEKAEIILSEYNARTEEIKKAHFIEDKYAEFAKKQISRYIGTFGGFWQTTISKAEKKLFKHDPEIKNYFSSEKILKMLNHIECEAHRDLIIEGLRQSIK